MKLWQCVLPPLAAAALALPVESAIASTCKDELDRFQSRLYGSPIPARDPDLFDELVREAERAAMMRDEERCLERVAELRQALPDPAMLTPTSRTAPAGEPADPPARPAAPILLVTDSADGGSGRAEREPADEEATEGVDETD